MTQNIELLGILEQNLASLVSQRQSFQRQLLDAQEASKELASSETAYQIVGTIMIKKSSKVLLEELAQKQELLSIKLESIIKQENSIRKQISDLQTTVMSEMDKGE